MIAEHEGPARSPHHLHESFYKARWRYTGGSAPRRGVAGVLSGAITADHERCIRVEPQLRRHASSHVLQSCDPLKIYQVIVLLLDVEVICSLVDGSPTIPDLFGRSVFLTHQVSFLVVFFLTTAPNHTC